MDAAPTEGTAPAEGTTPAERTAPSPRVAGMLLTGGTSRRMGHDKASLLVEGQPAGQRLARVLLAVAAPVVEVGPGRTGLPAVLEDPPGAGPLAAVSTGGAALRSAGHRGASLVVACDLPLLDAEVLGAIATWPGDRSVVPVVDGYPQPLCARWSATDLARAGQLVEAGERSLRALVAHCRPVLLDRSAWPAGLRVDALTDTDTPAALEATGLRWRPADEGGDPAPT